MENFNPAGFDLLAFWLEELDADASSTIDGRDCRLYRRGRAGDRMLDALSVAGTQHIIMNRSLFEACTADLAETGISFDSCQTWLHHQTGAVLQGDNLFYALAPVSLPPMPAGASVRFLTQADQAAFAALDAACSPEDLDAGFVELDHDIVVGVFVAAQLVAKASAYEQFGDEYEYEPGDETGMVWDIGYVTHPRFRQQGMGKAAAAFLAMELQSQGKIPQIRAADDRPGSVGIARALGFTRWGVWLYPESDE